MSTPSVYFEGMYEESADPWDLAGRWYEERKYALTLASLPQRRYRSAFEPGCSVGVLSAGLAGRCARLLATDRIPAAVEEAARRTRDLPQVEVRELTVPGEWPTDTFDLIVLSEILYYFDDRKLGRVLDCAVRSLETDGTLITVHWDHPVPEHHRTGSELAPILLSTPGLQLLTDYRDPDFTLHTFVRTSTDGHTVLSPAAAEGLV